MIGSSEYWAGVKAQEEGLPCPESASQDFQKGYGESYTANEMKPPIDLRKFNKQFDRIFCEG